MTLDMEDDPLLALPAMDVLIPGVPDHLVTPLWRWIEDVLDPRRHPDPLSAAQAVCLRLGVSPIRSDYHLALQQMPKRDLLKIVQAVLDQVEVQYYQWEMLGHIFIVGRSIYEAHRRDGAPRISRRIPSAVSDAIAKVEQSAPTVAAAHLRNAIRATYDLEPDPNKAYLEAVKAVEAVVCPLVEPKSTRATLSTTIRNLEADAKSAKPKWTLRWGGPNGQPAQMDKLVSMLKLLFQGNQRHGSTTPPQQTQEEAEWAVHLAAALVQMINTGVLRQT